MAGSLVFLFLNLEMLLVSHRDLCPPKPCMTCILEIGALLTHLADTFRDPKLES